MPLIPGQANLDPDQLIGIVAGYSGFSGYSGEGGASGFSGYSGSVGGTGDSGFSGYSGTSGFSGYSGTSGFSGYSGQSGFSGYSGVGTSGFSGYSGPAGPTGSTGASGFSGYSGAVGAAGVGISGFSGYSGHSGFSGYSGTSGISGMFGGDTQPYTFSVLTTVADPGAGILRFNNSTYSSVTEVYIDNANADVVSITDWLDALSPNGRLRFVSRSSSAIFADFAVVSVVDSTGYRTITVTYITGSGTFSAAQAILVTYGQVGSSGYSGYSGTNGSNGAAGQSGFSGYSGISGFSGYSGTSGFSGYSGPSGYSGYSGLSGYSGYSGRSGYGLGSGTRLVDFKAEDCSFPATSYALIDQVAGASSPAENTWIVAFVDASDTYIDFKLRMPAHYAGGGITLHLFLGGLASSTNTVEVGAAIRRIQDNTENITTSQTYDYNYGNFAMPATTGIFKDCTITFTSGADMDSLAADERFILRIYRDGDGTNGTDNYAGTMHLLDGYIAET